MGMVLLMNSVRAVYLDDGIYMNTSVTHSGLYFDIPVMVDYAEIKNNSVYLFNLDCLNDVLVNSVLYDDTDMNRYISYYCTKEVDCTDIVFNLDENKAYAKCKMNVNYSCVSYIKEDGQIIQSNPRYEVIEKKGVNNYFEPDNCGKECEVSVYFDKLNQLSEREYTYGVKCGEVVEEFNVTPEYMEMESVGHRSVQMKENVGYVFAVTIFLIIIIGAGIFVWRQSRRR